MIRQPPMNIRRGDRGAGVDFPCRLDTGGRHHLPAFDSGGTQSVKGSLVSRPAGKRFPIFLGLNERKGRGEKPWGRFAKRWNRCALPDFIKGMFLAKALNRRTNAKKTQGRGENIKTAEKTMKSLREKNQIAPREDLAVDAGSRLA